MFIECSAKNWPHNTHAYQYKQYNTDCRCKRNSYTIQNNRLNTNHMSSCLLLCKYSCPCMDMIVASVCILLLSIICYSCSYTHGLYNFEDIKKNLEK